MPLRLKCNLLLLLLTAPIFLHAQQWTFLNGTPRSGDPIYHSPATDIANRQPGSRVYASTWVCNGKYYLFGGYGLTTYSNYYHNDLWEYNPGTGVWTFLTGAADGSTGNLGNYGTRGVASASNNPPAKMEALSWTLNGKLYLFGGRSETPMGGLLTSDLWMYDPATNLWTWLSGSPNYEAGSFGAQGVEAAGNLPTSRSNAMGWVYNNMLYLFGGETYSDLWRYNPATNKWAWLGGQNNYFGSNGRYNQQGVPSALNYPSSRYASSVWTLGNRTYLYGGNGRNDLWRYDNPTGIWTWIHGDSTGNTPASWGTQGVSGAVNTPGGRSYSAAWVAGSKLALMGGNSGMQDYWEYDTLANQWTWAKGATTDLVAGTFGVLGQRSPLGYPGGRWGAQVWQNGNRVVLMGGIGADVSAAHTLNDVWDLDVSTGRWMWAREQYNPYGKEVSGYRGIATSTTTPSAIVTSSYWKTDSALYVFGLGNDKMWQYRTATNEWTWMSGLAAGNPVYGTKHVAAPTNTPGARDNAATWACNGKFYLFGGYMNYSYKNDLWEYDPSSRMWTWIGGTDSLNPRARPGTQGVPDIANYPDGRSSSLAYTIGTSLYLFGGRADSGNNSYNYADLWRYDVATHQWTWLKGGLIHHQYGVYGTQGTAAAGNIPGSRRGASGWVLNNKLYLYGGYGLPRYIWLNDEVYLNDLWEYDPATSNWRWLKGNNSGTSYSNFGTLGVAAPTNNPSGREGASPWTANNKLYLYGGYFYDGYNQNTTGGMSDIWEYDPATNNWTWTAGPSAFEQSGNYSRKMVPAATNQFASRRGAIACPMSSGKVYFFGGTGQPAFEQDNNWYGYNDVWAWQQTATSQPAPQARILVNGIRYGTLAYCPGNPPELNAGNPGSRYVWSTGDTTQSIICTAPGDYWVRVTAPNSLSASDTIHVTAASGPAVFLGKDTTLCGAAVITLQAANSNCTYLWQDGSANPTMQVTAAGTYYVQVTNTAGCVDADTITVSYAPIPTVTAGPDRYFCPGDSVTVSAWSSGLRTYSWSTGDTVSNISIRNPGTYYVRGTTAAGCSNTDTLLAGVYPVPGAFLGNDTAICDGTVLTLRAPGVVWWNNSVYLDTFNVNAAGTYFTYGATMNNCIYADTITVAVTPMPSASVRSAAAGGTVQFSLANVQYVTAAQWFFGDNTRDTGLSPTHTYGANGTYRVVVVLSNGSCTDSLVTSETIRGLGVNELNGHPAWVTVSPNPARDHLLIQTTSAAGAIVVSVTDITGKEVLHTQTDRQQLVLPLTGLANALYIVKVSGSFGVRSFKVTKQ